MPNDLPRLNALLLQRVEQLNQRFCLDPASRNYGGLVDPRHQYADSRNSIYDMQDMFAAYLYADFPQHHGKPWLLEKLRAHLQFMRARQRADGTIGLDASGVGGSNEVGFTLPGCCETYRRLLASDLPGREEILGTLKQYILRGAEAIRRLFPYTANHRWTACTGPLAVAHGLFPDPHDAAIIDGYLSDGIDMDRDGLYCEERSPNYNKVANWGLLYLADHWKRPDFLELIARNLRFGLAMRQPCGEAETLFSHRQDRGAIGAPWGDYLLYKRLAVETGDGVFATAADLLLAELEQTGLGSSLVPLRYFFDDQRLVSETIPRKPLPEKFDLRFQDHPLWRFRRGPAAATVVADPGGHFCDLMLGSWGGPVRSDAVMSYHFGDAAIDAIKLHWGPGTGAFRPERIEYVSTHHLRLVYTDPGWQHLAHFRPRAQWGPRHMDVDLHAQLDLVTDEAGRMELSLEVDGWRDMPINLQFLLRENCRLQMPGGAQLDLGCGQQTFAPSAGDYRLIGPSGAALEIAGAPASQHTIAIGESRAITGQAERRCHRLICGLFTPARVQLSLIPRPA